MKILALEYSTDRRGVAVLDGDVVLGASQEESGRSTRVFGLIAEALGQAGLKRDEVEGIAVGLGPGSYTGIRSAIAVAQGWQLAGPARRVKLLGVSSAECLAAEAGAAGLRGRLHVVIDAQRGELYHAIYEIDESGHRDMSPLRLATLEQVLACARTGDIVAGLDSRRWFPAGTVLHPTAAALGRLAANRSDFVPGEHLEPIYLRQTSFVKAPPPRVLPS